MTKLSERVDGHQKALVGLLHAVKTLTELAENIDQAVEAIDQREREENRYLRRRIVQLSEHIDVLMDAEAERIDAKRKASPPSNPPRCNNCRWWKYPEAPGDGTIYGLCTCRAMYKLIRREMLPYQSCEFWEEELQDDGG